MVVSIKAQTYREFNTKEDAEEWAQMHCADLMELSPENDLHRIIYSYTGNCFTAYNRILRACPPLDSDDFNNIDFGDLSDFAIESRELDKALRSYSLPEDIIVYRFTKKRNIRKLCNEKVLLCGMEFSDKAFFSTTLVKHMLDKFRKEHRCDCVLKLYLPKGCPGAYVSFKNEKSCLDEQEFLLPPNMKFRIMKIHHFTFPLEIECIAICN